MKKLRCFVFPQALTEATVRIFLFCPRVRSAETCRPDIKVCLDDTVCVGVCSTYGPRLHRDANDCLPEKDADPAAGVLGCNWGYPFLHRSKQEAVAAVLVASRRAASFLGSPETTAPTTNGAIDLHCCTDVCAHGRLEVIGDASAPI
ncbi:hypothetical protein EDC01DRAFT_67180 [Geopyxis carbonaria]|nr:hypothetical protein EDC01DRAFT_67180 [Geopyxis carbonaria]